MKSVARVGQPIASNSARKTYVRGRLTRIVGLTIEAVGCQASVGSRCEIVSPKGNRAEAEVVGLKRVAFI